MLVRISALRAWIPLKEGKTKLMMHEITVGCINTTVALQVWIDQSGPKEERGLAV